MAAYLSITSEDKELTVGELLALAAQLKRRKVSRSLPVHLLGHKNRKDEITNVEVRVPVKFRKIKIEQANHTPTKTPMRGAKRGKH